MEEIAQSSMKRCTEHKGMREQTRDLGAKSRNPDVQTIGVPDMKKMLCLHMGGIDHIPRQYGRERL